MQNHVAIAREICAKVKPLDFFQPLFVHGFYRSFSSSVTFGKPAQNHEHDAGVDILLIKQIDLKYLAKIRKLFTSWWQVHPPGQYKSVKREIETSRATIMNYIKYLKDARLLNLFYSEGEEFPKKPKQIYVQNTNLMHVVSHEGIDKEAECRTFFYNALHAKHKVNLSRYQHEFSIDSSIPFQMRPQTSAQSFVESILRVEWCQVGNKTRFRSGCSGFFIEKTKDKNFWIENLKQL